MTYARCTARTAKDEQCTREVAYTGADLCTQHGVSLPRRAGWYGMACFNGLSHEQQHRVVHVGNLPWGYEPEGDCPNGAEVEVTTMWDEFPGPRFYCVSCAVLYLGGLSAEHSREVLTTTTTDRLGDTPGTTRGTLSTMLSGATTTDPEGVEVETTVAGASTSGNTPSTPVDPSAPIGERPYWS